MVNLVLQANHRAYFKISKIPKNKSFNAFITYEVRTIYTKGPEFYMQLDVVNLRYLKLEFIAKSQCL